MQRSGFMATAPTNVMPVPSRYVGRNRRDWTHEPRKKRTTDNGAHDFPIFERWGFFKRGDLLELLGVAVWAVELAEFIWDDYTGVFRV
jgi:hypothetical protein